MNTTPYTPCKAIRLAALQAAAAYGYVEIAPGVYLTSQESMVAEQTEWGDEDWDESEITDFTRAPFWITTNDGVVQPVCGEDDEDLIAALANA